ncbi:MAG TPA: hypothetical protein PLJ78_14830 [Anaerolineae bacterium]|nr:hypothetical protein [Anaerolineae bacterium]HQK15205.1 hypothetical protein [Anaerolineae bacterium]
MSSFDHKRFLNHPYIWSRIAQAEQALNAAAPDLALMILELGYIKR